MKPLIPSVECNVGTRELSFAQASNAIWNKLNIAISCLGPTTDKQALDCIKEARELADLIVKHPDSGRMPLVCRKDGPYLKGVEIEEIVLYNPTYGDEKICECSHRYYRHFDTYEGMRARGCKCCPCHTFVLHKEGEEFRNYFPDEKNINTNLH